MSRTQKGRLGIELDYAIRDMWLIIFVVDFYAKKADKCIMGT